jgi:hypothetical protein
MTAGDQPSGSLQDESFDHVHRDSPSYEFVKSEQPGDDHSSDDGAPPHTSSASASSRNQGSKLEQDSHTSNFGKSPSCGSDQNLCVAHRNSSGSDTYFSRCSTRSLMRCLAGEYDDESEAKKPQCGRLLLRSAFRAWQSGELHVHVPVCIHVCMSRNVCVSACVHEYVFVHLCVCVCTFIYVYICIYVYVNVYS